jgi:opacity protein-like surface antigen
VTTKFLFTALFACALSGAVHAQKLKWPQLKFTGNNVAYFEVGGAGISHSMNYDRRFKKDNPEGFGFRAGYGGLLGLDLGGDITVFPVGINYVKQVKTGMPHSIEAGVGTTYYITRGDKTLGNSFVTTFALMYRLQPQEKGLVIRAGYAPFHKNGNFYGHVGAAIGYKF